MLVFIEPVVRTVDIFVIFNEVYDLIA